MAAALASTLFLPATFAAQAPPEGSVPPRIIDEEAARRAKEEAGYRPSNGPSRIGAPLRFVGRLLAVAEAQQPLKPAGQPEADAPRRRELSLLIGGIGVGSGPAVGARFYRSDFPFRNIAVEIPALVSNNRYGVLAFRVLARPNHRFGVNLATGYTMRPMDDFFGLGDSSPQSHRTNFNSQQRWAYVQPVWRFTDSARALLEARWSATNVFHGRDQNFADTIDSFSTTTVPGLRGASLLTLAAGFEHDSRNQRGMPNTGGVHRLGASWNQARGGGDFGYWKYRLEASRYVSLWNPGRVLALRFAGETNQPRGGSAVPFFDQVVLGGPFHRGYREFRFYDRTGVLATAEYRFRLNELAAAYLFLDEGQVARHPGDLNWGGMRTSAGVGLRFAFRNHPLFTISVGRSSEGTRLYVLFAPDF